MFLYFRGVFGAVPDRTPEIMFQIEIFSKKFNSSAYVGNRAFVSRNVFYKKSLSIDIFSLDELEKRE